MINILLDTSPLATGHSTRGIGMYTRLLAEALAKRADIQVFTSKAELRQAPDVIHYPFFDLFFNTLPLIQRTPVVVTVHDVIPLIFPRFYKAGVKGKLRFIKQKVALHKTAAVITDSLASQRDIEKHLRLKANMIHPILLAGHPQIRKVSPAAVGTVKKKYQLPPQFMLYVGDINYNKNIPQLIKSLKYLPEDIHLVCVGKNFKPHPIPEWHWIETQMALSDVQSRVHFLNEVKAEDYDDLSAIYTAALVYVQPSLHEGFGLPVLESMQCRTPVVATNTPALKEIGGSYAMYADPVAESLADQVKAVLAWSDSKQSKWSREAYQWSQQFSWDKTAQETVAVYQQVVSKQKVKS